MKRHIRHFVTNIETDSSGFVRRVSSGTAALGRRVGENTAHLARRVGPKRAIVGIAMLGAVIAGSIAIARYLKRRREAQMIDYDAVEEPGTAAGMRARNESRSRRESMRPMGH